MKRTIIFLSTFIILTPLITKGQVSMSVDSIAVNLISSIPIEQNKNLFNLYSKSLLCGFYERVDSIKYETMFAKQTFCLVDSTITLYEFYFQKADTLPFAMYVNGEYSTYAGWTIMKTRQELIKTYGGLKPVQMLNYESIQYKDTGCNRDYSKLQFYKNERKKELKNTYQIQIFFVDSKATVSVQTPAKRPEFEMKLSGGF